MNSELSDVILERVFESSNKSGVVNTITLQIGRPYNATEAKSSLTWRCPFQIIGIGTERIQEALGMDAIDALLVGLKLAELSLNAYSRNYGIKITWLNEDYLGLSTISVSEDDIQTRISTDPQNSSFAESFEDFFRDMD